VRIVSLLPSATEIVYALGLQEQLEGVTDECDFPPGARTKPVVSRSALPTSGRLSPREVDDAVRSRMDARSPLYELDRPLIQRIQPDVILAQDLCRVCAVPSGDVKEALADLGVDARVLSLDPTTLDEVIGCLEAAGKLLGAEERSDELARTLRHRVERIRRSALRLPSIRVLALEWTDPPFVGGHWIPEMIEAAGGTPLLSEKGQPSRRVGWTDVATATPEVIVVTPCGYYLDEAEDAALELLQNPDFAETPAAREGSVFAVDASSFFSRPGPRIVDGLDILAWAIHPEAFPEPPSDAIVRIES
jgi:iron complex transport system substrate-binding protein